MTRDNLRARVYSPRMKQAREIEVIDAVLLSDKERAKLDLHSFFNVVNVLILELILLGQKFGDDDALEPAHERASLIAGALSDTGRALAHAEKIDEHGAFILDNIETALRTWPAKRQDPEVKEAVANIRSVLGVLRVRAREILARAEAPERWVVHPIEDLVRRFVDVFAAIEKNSKGRYRIVYNIAEQDPTAYMVDLKINSVDGDTITMPPVLQDVMRDLIANARKYTAPGGEILAGLVDDGRALRFVVEDTGRGIPPDELGKVVGFGYRATNARSRRTMGGGFGLTKAYFVTRRFGGRMWIKSQLDVGTRITVVLPRPVDR